MTSENPTLVLLHGLGATGHVWDSFIETTNWSGRVIAPDLRGHGAADWTDSYSFGAMASDVSDLLEVDEPYVVLDIRWAAELARLYRQAFSVLHRWRWELSE